MEIQKIVVNVVPDKPSLEQLTECASEDSRELTTAELLDQVEDTVVLKNDSN